MFDWYYPFVMNIPLPLATLRIILLLVSVFFSIQTRAVSLVSSAGCPPMPLLSARLSTPLLLMALYRLFNRELLDLSEVEAPSSVDAFEEMELRPRWQQQYEYMQALAEAALSDLPADSFLEARLQENGLAVYEPGSVQSSNYEHGFEHTDQRSLPAISGIYYCPSSPQPCSSEGSDGSESTASADSSGAPESNDAVESEGSEEDTEPPELDIGPLKILEEPGKPCLKAVHRLFRRLVESDETDHLLLIRDDHEKGGNNVYRLNEKEFNQLSGMPLPETGTPINLVIKCPVLPALWDSMRTFKQHHFQRLLVIKSKNELEKLMRLKHPNIIQLLGYAEVQLNRMPGKPHSFLKIMENKGLSLCYFMKTPEKYSLIKPMQVFIAHQVLNGLEYIHFLDLSWGHLTPSHILIDLHTSPVQVTLIDFETCMAIAERIEKDMGLAGSIGFLAPEVSGEVGCNPGDAEHSFVVQESDIFSFGALCVLLTGLSFSDSEYAVPFNEWLKENTYRQLVTAVFKQLESKDDACRARMTNTQLEWTSKVPEEAAIKTIPSKEDFLLLMAALSIRWQFEYRVNIKSLVRLFNVYCSAVTTTVE